VTSTSTTVTNPPVGVVDNSAGFYVRYVNAANYTYTMHAGDDNGGAASSAKSYNYTLNCEISPGSTTIKDLMCYLEASELDLYFNGVQLQHNIPASMCSYVEILMPWYYVYPMGIGPSDSQTSTSAGGVVSDISNSVGGFPFCAYDFSNWQENYSGSTFNSVTTMTGTTGAGPNCCLGNYTNTQTVTTAGATTNTVTNATWGGKFSDCVGGPAYKVQKVSSGTGTVSSDLSYVAGTGANGLYTIASPYSLGKSSNMYVANYFTSSNYNNSTTYPAAFSLINNTNTPAQCPNNTANCPKTSAGATNTNVSTGSYSSVVDSAQPFYEYRCYNNAQELNYRIRVLIRAWDKTGQAGVSTGPYGYTTLGFFGISPGQEPAPFANFPLHDYYVWDDNFPSTAEGTSGAGYTNYMFGYPMSGE